MVGTEDAEGRGEREGPAGPAAGEICQCPAVIKRLGAITISLGARVHVVHLFCHFDFPALPSFLFITLVEGSTGPGCVVRGPYTNRRTLLAARRGSLM